MKNKKQNGMGLLGVFISLLCLTFIVMISLKLLKNSAQSSNVIPNAPVSQTTPYPQPPIGGSSNSHYQARPIAIQRTLDTTKNLNQATDKEKEQMDDLNTIRNTPDKNNSN